MIYVAHRINTTAELEQVPTEFGVEIDLREREGEIVLSHDPFMEGVCLNDYLKHYQHSLLILNMKSAHLEQEALKTLKKHKINNYFFLDSSMSSIIALSKFKEYHFAGRVSEFERITSTALSNNIFSWAWIDCFTKFSLSKNDFEVLNKKFGMRVCLTSPDLLGRPEDIDLHANMLRKLKIIPDAICTKLHNINFWKNAFYEKT